MMNISDLLAQSHGSGNGEIGGFCLAVLPSINLIYSWRISQDCETKVTDDLNERRITGLKPGERAVHNVIFSRFVRLSYL